jgi:3-methyladenine DNA glycosylase/8-oxoguanine DNA glycosylase
LPSVRLPLPPAFSLDAVVRSHGWYDLPPFEYDRPKGELRTWLPPLPPGDAFSEAPAKEKGRVEGRTHSGSAAFISFRFHQGRLHAFSEDFDRKALEQIALRVFSLDVELDGFAEILADQPRLARALARGGGRMLRAPTLFEDAVKMLLTTNCSWAATKGMVQRLIAVAGAGGRAFPNPESLARLRVSTLRSRIRCGYRAEPLARFARRVASGRLDLTQWERVDLPAHEIREVILAEHGFGPYASEGLLRVLGRHDFLAVDSWIRQKYRKLHRGPAKSTDKSIARRYARFGEYRGLALWLDMTDDWH